MARLYPPNISGTLPSFYSTNLGTTLVVPFSMNKTVGVSQILSFKLRIKTTSTDVLYGIVDSTDWNKNEASLAVNFILPEIVAKKLTVGAFYKIQLAYVDSANIVGYYSTVAIIKYTAKPRVEIVGLSGTTTNINMTEYVGAYHNIEDSSEKVYQYNFTLFNSANEELETSGWKLHNSYNDDVLNESTDLYSIKLAFEKNVTYKIQYSIITNNGLTINSPKYLVMQAESIDSELKAKLSSSLDYDNACVNLHLIGEKDSEGGEQAATGAFILSRAHSLDKYSTWTLIANFRLTGALPSSFLFRDFTIEHGVTYQYSIQQYNDAGVYSNRILSIPIDAYFEDAFLFDGKKQLKIRFNPKVSSFKTVLLESKTNTIGGQYPFIFKNKAVSYKEFPISGLVSYLMDNEEFFLSKENDLGYPNWVDATDVVDDNIALERKFKLAVLDWLNDGKIKLYKSPQEGNYLVRLTETSFAPNETLGRMLHTFNCTADEIAECTSENLGLYGLLKIENIQIGQMRWETILLDEFVKSKIQEAANNGSNDSIRDGIAAAQETDLLNGYGCYSLKITDMTLGTTFQLGSLVIMIGATGQYELVLDKPMYGLKLLNIDNRTRNAQDQSRILYTGSITYGIMSTTQNKFDTVNSVKVSDVTIHQTFGPVSNILSDFVDIKHKISRMYFARFSKLESQPIVSQAEFIRLSATPSLLNPYTIYDRYSVSSDFKLLGHQYYKFNGTSLVRLENGYDTHIVYGDVTLDVADKEVLYITELSNIPTIISIGSGVCAELSMQIKEIGYGVENICQTEFLAYQAALASYSSMVLGLRIATKAEVIANPTNDYFIWQNDNFTVLLDYEQSEYLQRNENIYTVNATVHDLVTIENARIDCNNKKAIFYNVLQLALEEEERELPV